MLDGLTERDATLVAMPLCTKPSDQVIDQGAVPVSVAWTVADPPAQTLPPPLTVAVGSGFTVTVVAAEVDEHPLAFVTVAP